MALTYYYYHIWSLGAEIRKENIVYIEYFHWTETDHVDLLAADKTKNSSFVESVELLLTLVEKRSLL